MKRKCFGTEMLAAFQCIRRKVNLYEGYFKTPKSCLCLLITEKRLVLLIPLLNFASKINSVLLLFVCGVILNFVSQNLKTPWLKGGERVFSV